MNDKRTHAALLTLGERGRAASEARFLRWAGEHPTEPCSHCSGKGCYTERAGVRRPFRGEDFSFEAGDRYEASCPVCRGGGKIFITPARARYLERRKLRETRRAYRALRSAVCAENGLEPAHFDRLARKRLLDPDGLYAAETPENWLRAARAVADFFGVSP